MVPSKPTQTHIAIGNLNLDISLSIPWHPEPDGIVYASDVWIGPGGAAANYSIALSRLGHKAVLYSRASKTLEKLGIIDLLRDEGVDVSGVLLDESIDARVVVILNVPMDSTRTLIKSPPIEPVLPSSLPPSVSNVHLATVHPSLLLKLRNSIGYNGMLSYDPGGIVARHPSMVMEAIKLANVTFLNNIEMKILERSTGVSPLEGLSDQSIVVVKHGDGGASVYRGRELVARASPPNVKVIDVTGAGDAFDAAFMTSFIEDHDLAEALKRGVAAGSAKVKRRGSSSMPYRREVEELVDRVRVTVYSY